MSQNKPVGKDLRLGDIAPPFTANSTQGEINFYKDTADSWVLLLCFPDDFSPVATTELVLLSKLHGEFVKRNVKLYALATHNTMVDGNYKPHEEWVRDVEEISGVKLPFPIIEDDGGDVAYKYGIIDDEDIRRKAQGDTIVTSRAFQSRTIFVLGPKKQIRLMLNLPAHIGLNTIELFRLIDGLQTAYKVDVRLPANWIPGGDIMIPRNVSNADAKGSFGDFKEVKPYLRFAPLPIEETTFQPPSEDLTQ